MCQLDAAMPVDAVVLGLHGAMVAQGYDEPWVFALGAVVASVTWFAALGLGARHLRPLFVRPSAWRVLDAGIALVMVAIGVSLLAPLI